MSRLGLSHWFLIIYLLCVALRGWGADAGSAPPMELSGVLSQGALVMGQTMPGVKVYLSGAPIKVTPTGHFVIGFGRDDAAAQILEWQLDGQPRVRRELTLAQRSYDIQRVEGVPQETVTPDPSMLARIEAEARLVNQARANVFVHEHFLQQFIPPMEARISGVYGSQRFYNGTPKRPHFGVDYAAPVGTPVYAPANGVVTLVHADMYFSGGTLIVDHGYGVSSTFMHLSKVLVKEGDHIKQGDEIAKVGKSGRASGPHLDWRMNWFDVRIDPQLVLKKEHPL